MKLLIKIIYLLIRKKFANENLSQGESITIPLGKVNITRKIKDIAI